MNELQIFKNEEFGTVRTVDVDGQTYFVASDVASALGYSRPADAVTDHCKGSVKRRVLTNGGEQEVKVIPEGDVYRLIIRSKLPSAEKFEKWVFDEVIPQIRKTGGYNLPQTYSEALRALADKAEEAERLALENEKMKPKAIFADAVSVADTSILVRELAKMIRQNGKEIGERRLYIWMRENGYIIKGTTEPTQRAMEMGLFEIAVRVIERGGDSLPIESRTTKVTGKGQIYFINKFLGK